MTCSDLDKIRVSVISVETLHVTFLQSYQLLHTTQLPTTTYQLPPTNYQLPTTTLS
ncbi:hypothetical protein [Chroococcidiopsis cubana]|uniref:hypothetical protein n=1 Tax=Chroococcidiopsis cubana TaxID=171392 RepID=UPI0013151562|nr:hypothetical protein [Chroococcidiopsis cubana]